MPDTNAAVMTGGQRPSTGGSETGAMRQFCTFFMADQFYGLDVLCVQEIIRQQPMTRVPLAQAAISGLINLRGQIVTAIDMRRRLQMPERPAHVTPVNVVVQTGDGAVSLLVDEIGDVLEVDGRDFERPPETLQGASRELIEGVFKLPDRLLLILNPELTVNIPESRD